MRQHWDAWRHHVALWAVPRAPGRLGWGQWVEVLALPLVAVGLSWWWSPTDPALSAAAFPWPWLAALLVALRYGVLPGLLAATVLVLHVVWVDRLGLLNGVWPIEALFGGGLLVLVSGEFSEVWRDRNHTMEETYLYANERLAQLTKRHLLLNLSHDRLEQEMLTRPGTLRDAMTRLRELTLTAPTPANPMPGALELMQLLSQYTGIEAGALYLLQSRLTGHRLGACVAELGEPEPLDSDDELLSMALEENRLAHIVSDELALARRSAQLIVAPMVSGEDERVGVLAVERIPFFALNQENLQLMLVMLGYFADCLKTGPAVATLQAQVPNLPTLFAQELVRLMRLQNQFDLPSQIVVMRFEGEHADEIPREFPRIKRGLDLYWQTFVGTTPVIAVLMPLSSMAAVSGFLARVEGWLKQRFDGGFDSLGVRYRVLALGDTDPMARLAAAVRA